MLLWWVLTKYLLNEQIRSLVITSSLLSAPFFWSLGSYWVLKQMSSYPGSAVVCVELGTLEVSNSLIRLLWLKSLSVLSHVNSVTTHWFLFWFKWD